MINSQEQQSARNLYQYSSALRPRSPFTAGVRFNTTKAQVKTAPTVSNAAVSKLISRFGNKTSKVVLGLGVGAATAFSATAYTAFASDDAAHPPSWGWSHEGFWGAFDTASIRRGYQVYKEVCSSCHSMNRIAYRNLVGVAFTEDEAKAQAADAEVEDGPDDNGEMFNRPGKLSDYFPAPYKNEAAARAANGGSYPPDLSLIIKAREGHEDYVFSLLTGYVDDPPAGINVGDKYYNPYFAGGAIGMAPPLMDETIEYEDEDIKPTLSQLAKDVTTFLAYCSSPEQDERKKSGLKVMTGTVILAAIAYYHKRFRWNVLKTRKFTFEE
eukprot:gb/GECH01005321.1/.p1 GENE.gb/GECH01005321.1/~~gb/GECH01005321.1/.p1  ORF type:complete len:326 (+),score=77.85 gb/GECH01005321.1/:1-978(+)